MEPMKVLVMIKANLHGENPKHSGVRARWITVPDTPKERRILARIERRMMGHLEPSEDEIVKEIEFLFPRAGANEIVR